MSLPAPRFQPPGDSDEDDTLYDDELRFDLMAITPKLAEEWLTKNVSNRHEKTNKIEQYARDMAAGRWRVTGEAIKFDTLDRLADGQNRLKAVIKSGQTIQSLVVFGVEPEAQDVMDSGVARSAADALTMHGLQNAHRITAAARIALAVEGETSLNAARFTNSEVQAWVMEHLEITEAHQLLGKDAGLIPLAPSMKIYTAWRFGQIDAEAAATFFEQLSTGVGVTDKKSPVLALRRRLAGENYGRVRRISSDEVLMAMFRAWNAWRKGDSLERVLTTSRTNKGLPKLI